MIRISFSSYEQRLAELTLLIAQDQSARASVKKGMLDRRMRVCQANTQLVRAILHKEVWDADDYAELQGAMARLGRLAQTLSQPGMPTTVSSFFQLAAHSTEEMRQRPDDWAEGSISMTNHTVLVEFSWFELYELVNSARGACEEGDEREIQGISKQIDAILDRCEDSRVFQLVLEGGSLPAHLGEDGVRLTGEALELFADFLDQRLCSEPHEDGECADNDILHILLPLQEKLRACRDASSKGTMHLLVRPL